MVVEVAEESAILAITEPWFLAVDARVELHPAVVAADLAAAGSSIDAAAREYRSAQGVEGELLRTTMPLSWPSRMVGRKQPVGSDPNDPGGSTLRSFGTTEGPDGDRRGRGR